MSKKMKEAIVENLQDIVNAGIKTTFTKKRLDELGVKIQATNINPTKIKKARKNLNLSQSIFAQLLNVSIASVRHWEQGLREPTGSTKVLLELLLKQPHILDYRITKSKRLVAWKPKPFFIKYIMLANAASRYKVWVLNDVFKHSSNCFICPWQNNYWIVNDVYNKVDGIA